MSQRPKYERCIEPPPLQFQERDGLILNAIYDYDGVLAKRHLKTLFWPHASERAMEMRLSLLYHQGYLDWPTLLQWRTHPVPEPVCWLGWKGMAWLAGEAGIDDIPVITKPTENKLRQLSRDLRNRGLRWQREPRWGQLRHDLAVVDFRLAVEKSAREIPEVAIEQWVSESDFLVRTDKVEFNFEVKTSASKSMKRGVRPDGYFVLVDRQRLQHGLPGRARFLVEIDMATHDLNSFAIEKAIAGWHYIQSPVYKERFGDNSGCWLVITTSEARAKHLMHEIDRTLETKASIFRFTLLQSLKEINVLSAPIWLQLGKDQPISLFGAV